MQLLAHLCTGCIWPREPKASPLHPGVVSSACIILTLRKCKVLTGILLHKSASFSKVK